MYQIDNQVGIPTTFIGPQGNLSDLANVKYNAQYHAVTGEFIESATIHSTYIDAELVNAKINFGEPYMGIAYSNEMGMSTVANGISVSPDGNSLSVSGNLTVSGDFNVVGSNNVIISDPILELGNQATMEQNTGVIMSRPMDEGNVGMVYITDQFSEYDNTLVIGYHNGWAGSDDIQPNVEANITVEVLGNLVAANYYGNAASMISLTGIAEGTYGNANVSNGSANLIVMNVDANGYIANVSNLVITTSANLQQTTDIGNITTNTVIFANTENSFVTYGMVGISNLNPQHTLSLGNESQFGNLYISGNVRIDTDGSVIRIGEGAALAAATELSPLDGAISVGTRAGREYQNSNAIAVGLDAGFQSQNANSIALGTEAGQYYQGVDAVAMGLGAGRYSQNAQSLAIGTDAGLFQQGGDAVAMGYRAGRSVQKSQAFAVGVRAGEVNQGERAMALGMRAGNADQGDGAVAIGFSAGRTDQEGESIAIGTFAGRTSQGSASVAIGYDAGRTSQSANSVAIGFGAGNVVQGANSVAIGYQAATTSQHANTVVINATGQPLETQTTDAIYLAPIRFNPVQVSRLLTSNADTGELVQANVMVSNANVGVNLGDVTQITEALSVGGNVLADYFLGNANTLVSTTDVADGTYGYVEADANGYGSNLLSISVVDGRISEVYNTFVPSTNLNLQQVTDWGNITTNTVVLSNTEVSLLTRGNVAVGTTTAEPLHSLVVGQDQHFEGSVLISGTDTKVSIGQNAGGSTGGTHTVAIGVEAGQTNQGDYAVALGRFSGRTDQGRLATGVGVNTGYDGQNAYATAIGNEAGFCGQHSYATAIGDEAGRNEQGSYSVALGFKAGFTGQHARTVVLNATGVEVNSDREDAFFMAPVRNDNTALSNVMLYNTSSNEVVSSNMQYEAGNLLLGDNLYVAGNIEFAHNIYGNGLFLNTTTDLPDGVYDHSESNEYGSNSMTLTIVNGRLSSVGNSFVAGGGLGTVSNIGNAASNVVQFINTETSFVTLGNVGISNGAVAVMGAHLVVGQDDTPYTSNMIHLSGNTRITQEGNIVSIGTNSEDLDDGAVAIGWDAGGSGKNTVAVGYRAGADTSGDVGNRVAIGYEAAQSGQKKNAVAVGYVAGRESQDEGAIAVGMNAGRTSQGIWGISIGQDAGRISQNTGAIAIGFAAGKSYQGENAIALGRRAGFNEQANNSIILNASGVALDTDKANAFHVSNVVQNVETSNYLMAYNADNLEVVRSNIFVDRSNLGIQNTAPQHLLSVGGNAWIQSNLYSGNVELSNTLTIREFEVAQVAPDVLEFSHEGTGLFNIHSDTETVMASSNMTVQNTLSASNVVALAGEFNYLKANLHLLAGRNVHVLQNVWVDNQEGVNLAANFNGNVSANIYYGDGGLLSNIQRELQGVTENGNNTTMGIYLEQNSVALVTDGRVGIANVNPDFMLTLGNVASEPDDGIMFYQNVVIAADTGTGVCVGPRVRSGLEAVQVGVGSSSAEGGVSIGYNAAFAGGGSHGIAIGHGAGQSLAHDNSIILNASGTVVDSTAVSSFHVNPVRLDNLTQDSNILVYDSANSEVLRSNVKIMRGNVHAGGYFGDGGFLSNTSGKANASATDILFTIDAESINGTYGNLTYEFDTANLYNSGNVEVSGNIYGNLVANTVWFTPTAAAVTSGGLDLNNVVNRGNTVIANTLTMTGPAPALVTQGNVGVGTNSPTSNLHVVGNAYITDDLTLGGTIYYTSDQRAKTNFKKLGVNEATRQIRKLQPKRFDFIDGHKDVTGFVAQEVEAVMPEAVESRKAFVPDIYQNAVAANNLITFENASVVDRLIRVEKILIDNIPQSVSTVDGDENSVRVGSNLKNGNVFVYGSEVQDFKVIRNDLIYATTTAALMEIDRRVSKLEGLVEMLVKTMK